MEKKVLKVGENAGEKLQDKAAEVEDAGGMPIDAEEKDKSLTNVTKLPATESERIETLINKKRIRTSKKVIPVYDWTVESIRKLGEFVKNTLNFMIKDKKTD